MSKAAGNRPILYSFRRCPYAIRARLALLVSDMACEIREVRLARKPPELGAASPKATVPVLVLPAGAVIDESLGIMRWAVGRHDPEAWLERDDPSLIEAIDGPFKHHHDRYKYPDRHGSDPTEHRMAALGLLRPLEARLSSHANLCGDRPGLADAAIMPFVRQFAATDRAWFDGQPLPGVQAWLVRQLASPLFATVMAVLKPWEQGDPPVLFPDGLEFQASG